MGELRVYSEKTAGLTLYLKIDADGKEMLSSRS
jgi:hypothetical protein